MEDMSDRIGFHHIVHTVGDLISHLEKLGRDRALIYDDNGNTYSFLYNDIALWDPEDEESPAAIFIGPLCGRWEMG